MKKQTLKSSTNKLVVSKGKIRIDNSDGTHTELSFVMPHNIAKKILCNIIGWKKNWVATTNTVENYQEVEKEFLCRFKN